MLLPAYWPVVLCCKGSIDKEYRLVFFFYTLFAELHQNKGNCCVVPQICLY